MYKIVKKERLNPVVWRFVVEAPRLASAALPGQFLIVHSGERGERIPLTISNYDPVAGTVEMVIQEIGASTKEICSFEASSSFADVVGPLGLPSDFTSMGAEELSVRRYVFIGGGVGAAPVYPQARWLHEHGVPVDVIVGAKSSEMLIFKEEMAAVCDNLYICTDDGSEGFHGLVTAMLEKLVVENGAKYTNVVAIGPMIMMKFATLTAQKLGLPIVVSLNTLMVDGTGMCGACRVSIDGKMRFACVDGPEFDGSLVNFDEAMRRQGMYRAQEQEAVQRWTASSGV